MTKGQGTKTGNRPRVCELPDYRWVVTGQEIIVRPEHVGEPEGVATLPMGLTFDANGDLLMAAGIANRDHGQHTGSARMVLLRSSDHGRTWSQQGALRYRETESGPEYAEGMQSRLIRLDSGRLVAILNVEAGQVGARACHVERFPRPDDPYFIEFGQNLRLDRLPSVQWGVYSDDGGRTWQHAPMDISPFKSAIFYGSSQIIQAADGTLVATFTGHLSQDELDSGITSNGLIRSRDGGLSWGDANPIVTAQPGSGLWYSENAVLPLPDGRWVCMMRLNNHNFSPLTICRSYSKDEGRTWCHPVRTRFHGGEPGMGRLPDGAILCAQSGLGGRHEVQFTAAGMSFKSISPAENGERPGLLYEVSYDGGLTWSYWGPLYRAEAGSPEHMGTPIIVPLDSDTAIAVYHQGVKDLAEKMGGYGPVVIGASWLRKAAADSPEAAGLEYPEWLEEMVLQLAVEEAEKIVTFPEEWHFRFDPDGKGLDEGWHEQKSFDSWDRMRIDLSGLWDKHPARHFPSLSQKPEPRLQNLDIPWYVTSFEMPETGGIPLLVLFGGVDGYCDVFMDGRRIGGQERPQSIARQRPFCISLDKGLAAGGHTIVVRLRKEYPRSAGIFRPIWIVARSSVPMLPHA